MRFFITVPFTIQTSQGNVALPVGSILELSQDQAAKLMGKVRPADGLNVQREEPIALGDWRPVFRAWLEGGALRTTGVCDDLAAEIIMLTQENLQLQAKLLRLHVGVYSGPAWAATLTRWRERAIHLFETEGIQLSEAYWQAAKEMRLLAFAKELGLSQSVF